MSIPITYERVVELKAIARQERIEYAVEQINKTLVESAPTPAGHWDLARYLGGSDRPILEDLADMFRRVGWIVSYQCDDDYFYFHLGPPGPSKGPYR